MTERQASQKSAFRLWTLTDGKMGDRSLCQGVAETLAVPTESRLISPRAPWSWFMPWGPMDPREHPRRPTSPLAPPFPDMLIATGRRTVPYLRALRRLSGERVFTVFLKDPRTGPHTAHFIWAFAHDAIAGDTVFKTLTSPHRFSPEKIAAARETLPADIQTLPRPRITVLLGGSTKTYRYDTAERDRFTAYLAKLADEGVSFLVSVSGRTEPALLAAARDGVAKAPHILWTGEGPNPYLDFLAAADSLVVTADSANMLGEATATGRPVLFFEGAGGSAKFRRYIDGLVATGALHPFQGRLVGEPYPPIDATPQIVSEILRRFSAHQRTLGLKQPAETTMR